MPKKPTSVIPSEGAQNTTSVIGSGANSPNYPKSLQDLAQLIDHTILKPDATREDILKLCHEARDNGFYSVCVNPTWIALCRQELKGTSVKVITVVGFPLGAMTTAAKVFETTEAIELGAEEIDMVLNIGLIKSQNLEAVRTDIAAVVKAAVGRPVKVILETALLTDAEKITACRLSQEAGANYVKTSTGFAKSGATVADIRLMRQTVGAALGVKASGGIKNLAQALELIQAGASRLGASCSVALLEEAKLQLPPTSPMPHN